MKINIGSHVVEINLHHGIYATDGDSAEGKTYLFRLLQAAYNAQLMTDSLLITYNPDLTEEMICKKLLARRYEFIMLDRADMYLTENIVAAMKEAARYTTIFADIKNWMICPGLCPAVCELELTDKGIALYVEDDI